MGATRASPENPILMREGIASARYVEEVKFPTKMCASLSFRLNGATAQRADVPASENKAEAWPEAVLIGCAKKVSVE